MADRIAQQRFIQIRNSEQDLCVSHEPVMHSGIISLRVYNGSEFLRLRIEQQTWKPVHSHSGKHGIMRIVVVVVATVVSDVPFHGYMVPC